jgi:hypothetical protein
MSTKSLFCIAGLAVCSIAFAAEQKAEETAPASRVTELQKQLVATAEEGRALARESMRAGVGSTEEYILWTTRSLEARLRAATTKQERIAVLTEALKIAGEQEAEARIRQRTGLFPSANLVAAHYHRIQAELDLAREEAK